MKNCMKKYLGIVALFVLVLSGILYIYLGALPSIVRVKESTNSVSSILIKGNVIEEYKDGKLVYRLTNGRIDYDGANETAVLSDVKGEVFDAEGDVIELTAINGKVNLETKEIGFFSGVTAKCASKGITFFSPVVKYFSKDQRFEAEGGIKITKDDITVTGDKLLTTADLKQYTVEGHAKMVKK